MRRLTEPDCGPGEALHTAIASLSDEGLLHLVSCPPLREIWTTLWKQGKQGDVDPSGLYAAALAAVYDEIKSLTPSQVLSLVDWFSSGRAVTRLTAGAPVIADGGTADHADFLFQLGGPPGLGRD